MEVRYLKKRELYKRAQLIINEPLPLCKEFDYRCYRGSEKITGGDYEIYSQCCGNWIRVVHKRYNEKEDTFFCEGQIFADYVEGKYLYEGTLRKYREV